MPTQEFVMSAPAIQKIFAQYCQYLDDGRLDDVAKLFADDGMLIMEAYGLKETGPQAIRAKYGQITDPKIKGAHATFNHIIDVTGQGDGATAGATADFMFIDIGQGQPRIIVVGRYRSRFAVVRGDWKIKEWNIEIKVNALAT